MRKTFISISIMFVLIFICYEILTESSTILESVKFSLNIWQNNIFPSLFPFFVLSELLVSYGLVEFLGEIFRPVMQRLFKIKGATAFVFIMSMISGFPSNAKYTRELYMNNLINEHEASKLLIFTCFSNPLFILGTISILFLGNKDVGILILLCHYLTNIIIGIIFRNFYPSEKETNHVSLKNAIIKMNQRRINTKENFGKIFSKALLNSINTLLLILGVVTMFLVLTTIIDNITNLNSYNQSILNGFFEMTQGLKYVSLLNLPLKFKTVLSTMILSFGGLSVHMQVISIIGDTKIKYLPFLIGRILHAAISGLACFYLFDICFGYV